jgi:UDP-GlcNAc:undecaprenyl-phosphate/decaprenyl-phosphate GlcNAc-1-phosphate transferase
MIINLVLCLVINFFIIMFFNAFNKKNYFLDKVSKDHAIHQDKIYKLGALIILIDLLAVFIFYSEYFTSDVKTIITYSLLVLFIGGYEDLKSTDRFTWRLILTIIISICFVLLNNFYIYNLNLGVKWIDTMFINSIFLKFIVTIFCLNTIMHAFNFLDGVNGNLSFYIIILLLSIFSILKIENFYYGDLKFLWQVGIFLILLIVIFNFPKPKIFIGDGGAYFFGFYISALLIYMSQTISFEKISIWYYANLMIFPFTEVFISFFRRIFFNKKKPTSADNKHMHHLIYNNLISFNFKKKLENNTLNSTTAIIMMFVYVPSIILNTKFYSNPVYLKMIFYGSFIFFIITYMILYRTIKK